MSRYFFRKSQRLSSEEDFKRVLSAKSFACKGMMRLYRGANQLGNPRFGVSVSKSCGNAVIRNRLKRLGREVFRIHQHEIPAGFDYILIFTNKSPKIKTGNTVRKKFAVQDFDFRSVENDFLKMIEMLRNR